MYLKLIFLFLILFCLSSCNDDYSTSPSNKAPVAYFLVLPSGGNLSTIYSVDAKDCSDNEDSSTLLQVRWDWESDGIWDTDFSSEKRTTHQFSTGGTKTIMLEVKDTEHMTDSTTRSVEVEPFEKGTVTDFDGNIYTTVKIGQQWWMAENLKVTKYRNGEAIPNVTDNEQWTSLSTGAYCAYNNDNGNIATYGLLYNWYAVSDSRNIAPEGWHVPTDDDWKILEMYLGMSQNEADATGSRGTDEGSKLKAESGWYNDGNGTNESGFSALPVGYRNFSNGAFSSNAGNGYWWSATEYGSTNAWHRTLSYFYSDVYRNYLNKHVGFTVRLIRD